MEPLSAQDASFLHIENDCNHLHVGGIAIFEGPPPSEDEFLAGIQAKLPLIPRYRQRVRFVPFGLGGPVWVDDPHFNIRYHVRRSALPAPGNEMQLQALVGRVMSQKLDRDKPLWEAWVVEGLEDDRWAIVSKVHHCMIDGVSGASLMTVMFDLGPDAQPPPDPPPWTPDPEPTDAELIAAAVRGRARSPLEPARSLWSALRAPEELAVAAAQVGRGLGTVPALIRGAPATSINGPLGPHRRHAWARASLDDVRTIRRALGGTVNDVVLTSITRAYRTLLQSRGEDLGPDSHLRSLVPVSVRRPGEEGTYNNRVSAMYAALPVGIDDPAEALQAVRSEMDALKSSGQAVAGDVLVSLSGMAPAMLLGLAARLFTRLPQRNWNTVTTNVPGPQFPLYVAGRRLVESFPYVPLQGLVHTSVAIFSYCGGLRYGVTADFDAVPDVDVLARGIEDGMAELLRAAGA